MRPDYFNERDRIVSNITSELEYRMIGLRNEQIENITVLMGTMTIPTEFEAGVTTKVRAAQNAEAQVAELNTPVCRTKGCDPAGGDYDAVLS